MNLPATPRPGSRVLPSEIAGYNHPPLVEVWLGLEFSEPILAAQADRQALRDQLGPEWPAAVGDVESFASPTPWTNLMGDRALRVTERGFSFGWLGHQGERYARYEAVRDGFVGVLEALRQRNPESQSRAEHWSVQYCNRIPRGTVWTTEGEWDFLALWSTSAWAGLGLPPQGLQSSWRMRLEDERGHLTIELSHVPSTVEDEADCLWLTLTADGPVAPVESGVFDGLDLGRSVIVRTFHKLVSPSARSYWGGEAP